MTDQYNILAKLPSMSWRGIVLPVVERSHSLQYETAPHKFIYRDGVATEMLGEQGRVFHYTIPMRESIVSIKEGLSKLFSRGFRELYRAYRDPSPGMLVDPMHGAILCTPASWEDSLQWAVLDGADVRISFVEYIPPGEKVDDNPPTLTGLYETTKAMDATVRAVSWPKQVQSPEPTTDPLSLAAGAINQLNYTRRRMNAKVRAVEARMAKVEDAAAEAEQNAPDPGSRAAFNLMRLQARKGRLDAKRLADAPPSEKAAMVIYLTADSPSTITQLASQSAMTTKAFLELNPKLARMTIVPAGTRYQATQGNAN